MRNYIQGKRSQGNQTAILRLKPFEWVGIGPDDKSLMILAGLEMPLIVHPLNERRVARKNPTLSNRRHKVILELVGLMKTPSHVASYVEIVCVYLGHLKSSIFDCK